MLGPLRSAERRRSSKTVSAFHVRAANRRQQCQRARDSYGRCSVRRWSTHGLIQCAAASRIGSSGSSRSRLVRSCGPPRPSLSQPRWAEERAGSHPQSYSKGDQNRGAGVGPATLERLDIARLKFSGGGELLLGQAKPLPLGSDVSGNRSQSAVDALRAQATRRFPRQVSCKHALSSALSRH